MTRSEPKLSVPRPWNWFLWASATVLGVVLLWSDLIQLEGLHLVKSRLIIGRDFLNVWSGGQLAISGQLDRLYDYDAYRTWQMHIFGSLDPYNYSYPPHTLFLTLPYAQMPYVVALAAWTIIGTAMFLTAAKPYMGALPCYLAALTPAAIVNIWCGHYGFVIGALWLWFHSNLEKSNFRTGALAGLMTIKPHLGLLIAASLLQRRKWMSIAIAIIVTLILIVLSGLAFGFDLWRQWFIDTSALQRNIMNDPGQKFYFLMMPSIYISLRNFPDNISIIFQIIFSSTAFFLFWKARNSSTRDLAFISSTATAVIIPYIFNYDLTVSSLGFAIVLYERWQVLRPVERIALWLGFASPLLVMLYQPTAPISLLLGLSVLVRQVTNENTRLAKSTG